MSTPLTDVTGYGEDSKRDDDEMALVSFDPKTPEIPRGSSMKGIERWRLSICTIGFVEKAKAVRQAVDAKEAEEKEDDEETTKRVES